MEFEDKFVGFIDILGWKNLVADAEAGRGLSLDGLLELAATLGRSTDGDVREVHPAWCPQSPRSSPNLDFQVTQISDCVVVSCEVSPAGAINLIAHCWNAAMGLLRRGIACRGYVTRGRIYHTAHQMIGSGYQTAFAREAGVKAFGAGDTGTPFIELDPIVVEYFERCDDPCVRTIFDRSVARDGDLVAIFPFQRLAHSFIVAGGGQSFDAEKERGANRNLRAMITTLKERILSHSDPTNERIMRKTAHYLAALDRQLEVCDRTDEAIAKLESTLDRPAARRRSDDR